MQFFKVTALSLSVALMGAAAGLADNRPALSVGVAKLPPGLDPSLNASNRGQRVMQSVFDKLINRDFGATDLGNGSELVPGIATAWTQVEPTVWDVDIRTDVVFHNGDKLTAEDVAFSFGAERMFGPDRMYKAGTTYFGSFKDVTVLDEDTVRFTTKEPDPIFPARFTSPYGVVVPRDYFLEKGIDGFNLAPIGTGPYKVAELRPDEEIRLVANDDYWGGTPPASEIHFIEIPEEAARITAILNGEVDIIANISPDQRPVIENASDVALKTVLIDNARVVALNTFEAPMDDRNLRKALIWSIDRQAIVDALWGGNNNVPHDVNYASHGEDYLSDRPIPTFDMDKAKEFLAASDYDGEELIFRIFAGYYDNYDQVAQVLQQQWRAAGINVKIELRDTFADVVAGSKHMFSHSNGMQIPDITHPVKNLYGPTGIRTRSAAPAFSWTPPDEFFELLTKIDSTVDHAERMGYFSQVLDTMNEERPQIPLFMALESYAVRDGVNWKPYSFWPMDFGPGNLSFD